MTTKIVCGTHIDLDQIPNYTSIPDVKAYLIDAIKGSLFKIVEAGDRRHNYQEMEYYLSYDFPSQMSLNQLGVWLEKVRVSDIQKEFSHVLAKLGQKGRCEMVIQAVYHF